MIIFYGKSDSQKNKARVIGEGQWMIQDHYLVMKRWTHGLIHVRRVLAK